MFDTLTENLKQNGFEVSCFSTAKEAAAYLNQEIDGVSVGFGGSVTLISMGMYESLGEHNDVYWHAKAGGLDEAKAAMKQAACANVYLSSVNGIAETGEIINIDATCNRISSTLCGHEKVYLVVGKNKIRPDYDSALDRARNIAAPKNAQRLKRNTPCAEKGDRCYDCKSPDRICRGLTVLWRKPESCAMEIVLIDEELGF